MRSTFFHHSSQLGTVRRDLYAHEIEGTDVRRFALGFLMLRGQRLVDWA